MNRELDESLLNEIETLKAEIAEEKERIEEYDKTLRQSNELCSQLAKELTAAKAEAKALHDRCESDHFEKSVLRGDLEREQTENSKLRALCVKAADTLWRRKYGHSDFECEHGIMPWDKCPNAECEDRDDYRTYLELKAQGRGEG